MRRTHMELLSNILKALPIFTAIGGAMFGYAEDHGDGYNVISVMRGVVVVPPDVLPWREVMINTAIAATLGLTGGIALLCFSMVILHQIPVQDDPSRYNAAGAEASGITASKATIYFKKSDVDEHEKSTARAAEKYALKRQKEEEEKKELLEHGTEGIRAKKFGTSNKSKVVSKKKPGK